MFDHVSLGTSDLARATEFYGALFACIGAQVTKRYDDNTSFGPDGTEYFYLYQQKPGVTVAGGGTHVAFAAKSPDEVDALYREAQRLGAEIRRPAGTRPDIGPRYYGTVVLDFDGNVLEVVAYI